MRDARAALAPAAVAGDPDDLSLERAAPEIRDLRRFCLMHGVVAQVQPQAAAFAQALAHGAEARLQHGEEVVHVAEVVVVRERAARTLHAAATGAPGVCRPR
jgi:hypothetical protein